VILCSKVEVGGRTYVLTRHSYHARASENNSCCVRRATLSRRHATNRKKVSASRPGPCQCFSASGGPPLLCNAISAQAQRCRHLQHQRRRRVIRPQQLRCAFRGMFGIDREKSTLNNKTQCRTRSAGCINRVRFQPCNVPSMCI
jgi:hypothetical protein